MRLSDRIGLRAQRQSFGASQRDSLGVAFCFGFFAGFHFVGLRQLGLACCLFRFLPLLGFVLLSRDGDGLGLIRFLAFCFRIKSSLVGLHL